MNMSTGPLIRADQQFVETHDNGRAALSRGYDASKIDPYNIPGWDVKSNIFESNESEVFNYMDNPVIKKTDRVQEFSSLSEFFSFQKNTVSFGLSIPFVFSFSAQSAAHQISNVKRTERKVITAGSVFCQRYAIAWKPQIMSQVSLSKEFEEAVEGLPNSFGGGSVIENGGKKGSESGSDNGNESNKDKFEKFITTFGTHYAKSAQMGGKASHFRCYSEEHVKTLSESGLSVGVGVKAFIEEVVIGGSMGMSNEERQVFESVMNNSYEYTQLSGGEAKSFKFDRFPASIPGNDVAITIDLECITELFDLAQLKDVKGIKCKKKALKQAIGDYFMKQKLLATPSHSISQVVSLESFPKNDKGGAKSLSGAYTNSSVCVCKSEQALKVMCVFTQHLPGGDEKNEDNGEQNTSNQSHGSLCFLDYVAGEEPRAENVTRIKNKQGEDLVAKAPCVICKDDLYVIFYKGIGGKLHYVRGVRQRGVVHWEEPNSPKGFEDTKINDVSAAFVGQDIMVGWRVQDSYKLRCAVFKWDEGDKLFSQKIFNKKGIFDLGEGKHPSIAAISDSAFIVVSQGVGKLDSYLEHQIWQLTEKGLNNTLVKKRFGFGKYPRIASIDNPLIVNGKVTIPCSSLIEVHQLGNGVRYRFGEVGPNWEISWMGTDEGHHLCDGTKPSVSSADNESVSFAHHGLKNHSNLYFSQAGLE